MSKDAYTLTSPDGARTMELPVKQGTLGPDVLDISQLYQQQGVFTYDPGYGATGSCDSRITFIDGEQGVLLYRGYPVEQLAKHSNFLEVAYLLLYGELPDERQLGEFDHSIRTHTMLNEGMLRFFTGFRYDAHPMAMLSAVVGSMSAYYHDTMDIHNPDAREVFAHRILAKMPTIAAAAYKHTVGQPFVYPRNDLGYCENMLQMFFAVPAEPYRIDPVAAQALDLLFILHADHEQNCSTSTVRVVGSSQANLFASIAAGICALWGPLHGGANQRVLEMLEKINQDGGDVEKWVEKAKDKDSGFRLMGFGHRVYKNYDPRAKIIKGHADTVLNKLGIHDPLLEIAMKLERAALEDDYFVERKLYPNVDFYSGLIYRALGFPTNMFTVLFALGRLPGWIAQWKEMIDARMRISRPRQIYIGETERDYVPIDKR